MREMQLSDLEEDIPRDVLERAQAVVSLYEDGRGICLKHVFRPAPHLFKAADLVKLLTTGIDTRGYIVVANRGAMVKQPEEILADLKPKVEQMGREIAALKEEAAKREKHLAELEQKLEKYRGPSELERHRVGQ